MQNFLTKSSLVRTQFSVFVAITILALSATSHSASSYNTDFGPMIRAINNQHHSGLPPAFFSPNAFGQLVKKFASDGTTGDQFGYSVAISGDTAVVGAKFDNIGGINKGSAYVFVRSGNNWVEQAKLVAADGTSGDAFGHSVSIDGNTVVVGANLDGGDGSAYVFTRSGSTWSFQQKIEAAGDNGDLFGNSVSVSGNSIVVGAPGDDFPLLDVDQGSAYVFTRSGSTWSQQQKLSASDGALGDNFGRSVSISGDTVVAGSPSDDNGLALGQGSAYVFFRTGSSWAQQQKIVASDGLLGDAFGSSVAISGETLIAGAELDDSLLGIDQGSAYVYLRSGSTWSLQQKLVASNGSLGDHFGGSVAISGNSVAVGAYANDIGLVIDQGAAYSFTRSGSSWSQQRISAADVGLINNFGFSVGVSPGNIVIGADLDDFTLLNIDRGSVYFFSDPAPLFDATVLVSSGPNPSLAGQPVTITATVTPVQQGTGTPTGTVTFSANGTPLCQATVLASGSATCVTSGIPVGSPVVITVLYSGDPSFNPASGTLSGGQNVTKANSTVAVVSNQNPSVAGQQVTFTATVGVVAPGTGNPTGTVTFLANGSPLCANVTVTAGQAACTSPVPVGSPVVITVEYSGDPSFNPSSGTLSGGQTVTKANSTVAVVSNQNPSVAGQPVTLTATVGVASPGSGNPTGTVTFLANGNPLCQNVTVTAGQAACTGPIPVGSPVVVTVQYSGDPSFNPSSGTLAGGQNVTKADSSVAVVSSQNPSTAGQPVTFTATVSAVAPGTGTPTGTATFNANGSPICQNVTVTAGQAACTGPIPTTSPVVITVQYSGDPSFNPSTGTLAGGQNVGRANSTVAVVSNQNPSVAGQPVTFTATVGVVAPGTGNPTGTVTFSANGSPLCSNATVTAGQAVCATSATPTGSPVVITAQYSGDPSFNPSTGTLVGGQSVGKANTTVAVVSNQNPSVTGQSVTFTASVSVVSPGSGNPTGTVTFSANGIPICLNAAVNAATAACVSSSVPTGSPVVITVQYSGDTSFNPSSGTLAGGQNVAKANTSVAVVSNQNPSVAGQPVVFTATVSVVAPGSGVPSGTVNFTANGAPICSNVLVAASQAACPSSTLPAGSVVIAATYSGDGSFNGSSGSMSGGGQTVNKGNTLTVITNASQLGSASTLSGVAYPVNWSVVPVAPSTGTPTGSVVVTDGTDTCTAAIAAGTCNLLSTTAGSKTLTAVYGGDSSFNGSSSNGVTHVVEGVPTATPTPTPTPAATPTPTPTPAATPTPTPTPTPAATPTPTPTPAATPTPSPSPNLTPTPTPVPSPTPTPIPSPTVTPVPTPTVSPTPSPSPTPATQRIVRAVGGSVVLGQPQVTTTFDFDSHGNETHITFTVVYDPTKFSGPVATLGDGVPDGSTIGIDTSQLAMGRLGIMINSPTPFAAGTRHMLTMSWTVTPATPIGSYPLNFDSSVIALAVFDQQGFTMPAQFQSGFIKVVGLMLQGRVFNPVGIAHRGALVSVIDSQGVRRTSRSNSFGIYQFENLIPGENYIVSIASKRYRFTPRNVQLFGDATLAMDFYGLE